MGALPVRAADVLVLPISDGAETPVSVYGKGGKNRVLWFASEHGVTAADQELAAKLAAKGWEVWVPDFYAAHFLPLAPSSLEAVPRADVPALFGHAFQGSRKVYVVSAGAGAALALEGVAHWQRLRPRRPIAGAVLLFPNLLTGSPEAGEEPTYLPFVTGVRLPIHILQGDRSPWYWHLDTLQQKLRQGGSTVNIAVLPGMRDRFYFREDAFPAERSRAATLADDLDAALRSLAPVSRKPR